MVAISNLPEVLYKPNKFFNYLKGETSWKEGVIIFFFSTAISLTIYGAFAKLLGTSVIVLSFGVGNTLSFVPMLLGFLLSFGFLFLGAIIAGTLANFLGGNGYIDETIGMFGYSTFLSVPRSIAGMFLLVYLNIKVAGIEGAELSAFFSGLVLIVGFLSAVFLIWDIWIKGNAVSVEYDISLLRGIIATSISVVIITLLGFSFGVL